jgi:RNA polymerase primary sigma factor
MNEKEFTLRINDLLELASDQENVLFTEQIHEIFPETKDDSNRMQIILDFLKEKHIGINEKLDAEESLSDDEKKYLEFYLDDLRAQGELTAGEREAFLLSAMAGEVDAKTRVVTDYLKNVVEIAKLYVGQGVLIEDLIGEGNIALLGAVEMLGAMENAKEAEGFLAKSVMDAMQDMIGRNFDEKSAEEKILKLVNKVSEKARELSEELKRKVTIEELSEEYKISKSQILKALKLTANKIEEIEIPEDLK